MSDERHYHKVSNIQYCYYNKRITAYGFGFVPQDHDDRQPLDYWKSQLAFRCLSTHGSNVEILKQRLREANITEVNPAIKTALKDFMRRIEQRNRAAKIEDRKKKKTLGGQVGEASSRGNKVVRFANPLVSGQEQESGGDLEIQSQVLQSDVSARQERSEGVSNMSQASGSSIPTHLQNLSSQSLTRQLGQAPAPKASSTPDPTALQIQALFLAQQVPNPDDPPQTLTPRFVAAALSALDEVENYHLTGDRYALSRDGPNNNYRILVEEGQCHQEEEPLKSWNIYGDWVIQCKDLIPYCEDEPLTMEIFRAQDAQGVQICGAFKFELAYHGVFRFCNTPVGPPLRKGEAEYILEYPADVSAQYPSWCYRWRGREDDGDAEMMQLGSDDDVWEMTFSDDGQVMRGSWSSHATGRTKFTGTKVEDAEGDTDDLVKEVLKEWRSLNRKAYDRENVSIWTPVEYIE